jgi:hypothetical protein
MSGLFRLSFIASVRITSLDILGLPPAALRKYVVHNRKFILLFWLARFSSKGDLNLGHNDVGSSLTGGQFMLSMIYDISAVSNRRLVRTCSGGAMVQSCHQRRRSIETRDTVTHETGGSPHSSVSAGGMTLVKQGAGL